MCREANGRVLHSYLNMMIFEMPVRHSGKGKVGVQYTLEPKIQIRSGGVMNWESLSLRYYSNPGD